MDEIDFSNKYLIYGTDYLTESIVNSVFTTVDELEESGCVGFITTDSFQKEFMSLPAYIMTEALVLKNVSVCIVNSEDYDIQKKHLTIGYGLNSGRVKSANWLIFLKVYQKYKNSQKSEIMEILSRIRDCDENDDFIGFCTKAPKKYPVTWDPEYDMPFIFYEGKRIYYPRNQSFLIENGNQYVIGIEYEQQPNSPHLYISNEVAISDDMVIVDAGVCEGNFAIKYVDKCKKMYLIEPSPDWYYPLRLTFKDYMNKVIFCRKYLSGVNNENCITLDSLVGDEKVDFIKMDIEGCEIDALLGARNVFKNNNLKCSICSYHKHDDQKKIESILDDFGYKYKNSSGYMIYLSDVDRFTYCELRRGIVYGWKA